MTSHVFTYGSLMFAEVWTRIVTGRYRSVEGTLHDHARFAVIAQDYPGMIHAPGASVTGMVHLDVDAADVERLDRFEGDDYRRVTVSVACSDEVVRSCGTYLYLPVDRLTGTPWEPAAFAMERFLATYCREWPKP
jgi:gamma-glutamylcyclotransferase (GGCT)/AIG2-like uncharacterized protein YtfP